MNYGQALSNLIGERNETQEVPAKVAAVSSASISKYIRGKRRPPKDVMRKTVEHYEDFRLTQAAQEEVSGPACVPYLDNSDLHPSTVHIKVQEETEEAMEAFHAVPIAKRKERITPEDREAIQKAITEGIEAITAITHYVAILCREYGFSWLGVWKAHRSELKAKKYIN